MQEKKLMVQKRELRGEDGYKVFRFACGTIW